MWSYVARRVVSIPLLLLGIVSIAFVISRLVPANPLSSILSERALGDPQVVAAARARWGLDDSLPEQYLTYVANLFQGDLGTSFRTKNGVLEDLVARFPATLELMLAALLVAVIGGVAAGVIAAAKKDTVIDHGMRLFSLVGSSMPVFWTGLIFLYIFSGVLGWLPGPGRLPIRVTPPPDITGLYTVDSLLTGDLYLFWLSARHLVLPAIALGWGVMGTISRIVRASMLDALNEDYVRSARARGVSEFGVLTKHALRNALMPTLTIIGFSLAFLITGAVLVEIIFLWPGIGSYAVEAAKTVDFPAIMGVTLVGGTAFLLANLLTDLAYAWADPRVRL